MFDFAEATKEMSAAEILNYYRNLYYAEPQVTERGIVANAINDYLTADVEKIRHAKWIYKGHHDMMGHAFRCSVCERWMFTNSLNNIVGEYPYCHCGAKMEDTQGFGENYD